MLVSTSMWESGDILHYFMEFIYWLLLAAVAATWATVSPTCIFCSEEDLLKMSNTNYDPNCSGSIYFVSNSNGYFNLSFKQPKKFWPAVDAVIDNLEEIFFL